VFDFTQILEFFYGVTWNLDRKNIFPWKGEVSSGARSGISASSPQPSPPEEEREKDGIKKTNYEAKVRAFFAPVRMLEMLKEWILFLRQG